MCIINVYNDGCDVSKMVDDTERGGAIYSVSVGVA